MKDYSAMSDFEINCAVAIYSGYSEDNCDLGWLGNPAVGVEWNEDTGYPTKSVDYCNSWADAGPIIADNNIVVAPYRHSLASAYPTAFGISSKFHAEDKNPLRAAMIVFLMMKDAE